MGYSVKLFSLAIVIFLSITENSCRYSEGDIRLIGGHRRRGSRRNEGTVLIYHNRQWGSICDRGWDIWDARVVCRQLGFSGARRAVGRSIYGIGRRERWMSRLQCRGHEKKLSECGFSGWGNMRPNCRGAARSAGVRCERERVYQPAYQPPHYRYPTTKRTTTTKSTTTTSPTTTTTTPAPTTTTPTTTTTTTTTTPTTTTTTPTTTTTTTPAPTTTTTERPTTTTSKPTTSKPTSTVKTTPHYRLIQQDEQYIRNDISFEDIPNEIQIIPDPPSLQVRTSVPDTTTAPRPTTTSTPRPTTTTTPKPTTTTTPKPTTTTTPKPTTTPRPPRPFLTTRRPQHRTTRRTPEIPQRDVGVWFEDDVLDKWVLYDRTGMVLIAEAGHQPDRVTEIEYRRRRGQLTTLDVAQADDSFSNVIVNQVPVEGGTNEIDLSQQDLSRNEQNRNTEIGEDINNVIPGGNFEHQHRHRHGHGEMEGNRHVNRRLQIRLRNGRSQSSGRIEVMPRNTNKWGVICGDKWSFREAMVACKQLGMGYAQQATKSSRVFGGQNMDKHFASVTCTGKEQRLKDCQWTVHEGAVSCSAAHSVAGIICVKKLPDLEPDIRMLRSTVFLQDRPLYYLTCAMEEKCLSSSAYQVHRTRGWTSHQRRLLRFSSVVHNKGTADFRPLTTVDQWEWHACHRHYHSMDVFAHYDVLDSHGNRVAEGLKASFCLEDSSCKRGVYPRYECARIGNQGISVGCSDNYMHDIDCQWIDLTDVPSGTYTFKLEVNPQMLVPEISYENNIITCELRYSLYAASFSNCKLGSLL